MKLQPMTDFVLEQYQLFKQWKFSEQQFCLKTVLYADFLKQPIKLGMFIPCDENDEPLEETIGFNDWSENSVIWTSIKTESEKFNNWFVECSKYQRAKERVLFKGFEIKDGIRNRVVTDRIYGLNVFLELGDDFCLSKNYKTIEDLVEYNLELTDYVIEQLNL